MKLRRLGLLAMILLPGGCALPHWPVEGPMTSPFGLRNRGTILPTTHHGVDLRAPTGTPVHAMAPGRVRFAGEMRGYGRVVWIDHRGGALSLYAHLSEILVQTGETVGGRQVIGRSGATGAASAPHLHFEVRMHGRPVDPVMVLGRRPPADRRRRRGMTRSTPPSTGVGRGRQGDSAHP